jgi:hypothetical protein
MAEDESAPRLVAFLSWVDALERIDTLMLEIRHVQETIVGQLRVGKFLEPFRYEDHYLWGRYVQKPSGIGDALELPKADFDDWSKAIKELPSVSRGCKVLSQLWCPEFPPKSGKAVSVATLLEEHNSEIDHYQRCFHKDDLNRYINSWKDERHKLSKENRFHANEERLYEALRYLQLLKRDLLCDKLILVARALAALQRDDTISRDSLAFFLVVRRGALNGLHARLEHFRDVVATVQEILSLSLERDPTPSVRRRRDQGIYTTDLSDSCRAIAREIASLFAEVKGSSIAPDGYIDHDDEFEFIIHRFTRSDTSTVRFDASSDEANGRGPASDAHLSKLRTGFVQSSFWMPERPDLQPVIAHEIAHAMINRYFQGLKPNALDGMDDPFARLLRTISYVFEQYSSRFVYFDFSARTRENLLLEVACDLISVAVHRTSFVFAQFFELACFGCETLFSSTPTADIAQSASQLEEHVTLMRDRRPEWYLRLVMAIKFSRAVSQKARSHEQRARYLEDVVHDGIETMTKQVRAELSSWMDGDQKEDWETWFEMANVVVGLIPQCAFVDTTNTWLQTARAKKVEFWQQRSWIQTPFNRYVPRLPEEITKGCLGAWLDRLVEVPRALGSYLNTKPLCEKITYSDVISKFYEFYLDIYERRWYHKDKKPELLLFNYLIDIPWQTAVLTARDFLGTSRSDGYTVPNARWISAIHEFNWLGRDLYHSALEFVVWHERPAIGRLMATNRWLGSLMQAIDEIAEPSSMKASGLVADLRQLQEKLLVLRGGGPKARADDAELAPALQEIWQLLRESWPPKEVPTDARDKIKHLGTELICDNNPIFNYSTKDRTDRTGVNRQKWIDICNFIAMEKMNQVRDEIHRELKALINKHKEILDGAAPLSRPVERILSGLISLTHYLNIRPESEPGDGTIRHHQSKRAQNWNAVFAGYLDVPVSPRKLACSDSPPVDPPVDPPVIEGLVPTRSIRIDRFSALYQKHLSSFARLHNDDDPAVKYPGYFPADNLQIGRPLFWTPWGTDGKRIHAGSDVFWTQTLDTPLLGRFDRLRLDVAKHTARSGMRTPRAPFFRRQQIGLPFAARIVKTKTGNPKTIIEKLKFNYPFPTVVEGEQPKQGPAIATTKTTPPAIQRIPLATINILLSQRSARLTFVERLIAENIVMKSYHERLSSPYEHFRPDSDIGLLTDGWGDMFLVLFAEPTPPKETMDPFALYIERCNEIKDRLLDVVRLRQALFEDTLVVRTETSYTPLAIDAALINPDLFECTMTIRLRPTLDGTSLCDLFDDHMRNVLENSPIGQVLSLSRIPGRMDYEITTKDATGDQVKSAYKDLCVECADYRSYGIIFEMLRYKFFHSDDERFKNYLPDHIESTTTTIGEFIRPRSA